MSMRTGTLVRANTGVPPRMSGFLTIGPSLTVDFVAVIGAAFGFSFVTG